MQWRNLTVEAETSSHGGAIEKRPEKKVTPAARAAARRWLAPCLGRWGLQGERGSERERTREARRRGWYGRRRAERERKSDMRGMARGPETMITTARTRLTRSLGFACHVPCRCRRARSCGFLGSRARGRRCARTRGAAVCHCHATRQTGVDCSCVPFRCSPPDAAAAAAGLPLAVSPLFVLKNHSTR
jgi:hypothetical protein